ncbi:FHA domain-containing protein [Mesorhizobium sp. RP14(2022)]|uniref:FHA domain-containing protein n=1 Tax=Mesorhizobium liriopis TaxID=2953882 RepID=A0ABT1CAB4_9HYPH|nr:FHA domain-containing protein [Mesorhizobium liriopis]MCO6051762.1 FHA domain-containing protein [Mesorhizobium liriopis]
MRLRLVKQGGEQVAGEKGWRLLEQGEMTLGRANTCSWVIADPERRTSSLHCRITRDAQGFALRDESTNGTVVDNRSLAQGETVRLRDGSVVAISGNRFRVEITGEIEPDWVDPDQNLSLGDEVPSITSILADVAPSGRTATGILPGRLGDDWMNEEVERTPREGRAQPASRASVGWGGPPDTSVLAGGGVLPDDWDTEAEAGSRSEHVMATSTRVRLPSVPRSPDTNQAPVQAGGPTADEALDAFLQGLGESGGLVEDPLLFLRRMGAEVHTMREALRSAEREMRELYDDLGEAPPIAPATDLATRLTEVRRDRERLVDALRELLRETDKLDPDALERRAAVETAGPPSVRDRLTPALTRMRGIWSLFSKTYRGVSVNGSPRARFTARLMGTATPVDDEFEELRADPSSAKPER